MSAPVSHIFIKFLEEHKGIIYKVANAYCRDEEDRKDLIQEIIFQLWRSFAKYDQQYRASTWTYRIALNVSISFYRKEKRRTSPAMPLTKDILRVTDPYEDAALEENVTRLHQFINQLPALHRALMILYLDEKSYAEIASILGITETNVATKISRIKQKLKRQFEEVN